MSKILIVEDEDIIRSALKRLLERNSYSVFEADCVSKARTLLQANDFNLIISDLKLPDLPGTDIIQNTNTPVLIMTSYASLRSAVDAMKSGAIDYIAKPFDHDEMLLTVERTIKESSELNRHIPLHKENPLSEMLGHCHAMQELFHRIHKVAPTDATVLILGESGTGKELAAKAIHEHSQRKGAPLISVNCAAIPETLIESELFGHEKGAFTGAVSAREGLIEAADTGTLFLDEIGELPLEAQARLLRVLQESDIRRVGSTTSKKVDIRVIAATHRDLKSLSANGQFREDLYYRLNVVDLRIPPLRERGGDILELAQRFLERTCNKLGSALLKFSETALIAMSNYHWPGNVRELENSIERAVILSDHDEISEELLAITVDLKSKGASPEIGSSPYTHTNNQIAPSEPSIDLSLEDYFQHFVLENQDQMTETELAQKLGISRKSLWEKRQRLGIPRKKTT